jgi:hypothetical protein
MSISIRVFLVLSLGLYVSVAFSISGSIKSPTETQSSARAFTFPIEILHSEDQPAAMLMFGDLDNDSKPDFIVMGDQGYTAYGNDGHPLWKIAEAIRYNGRRRVWDAHNPYSLFPSARDTQGICEDVDGDGKNEWIYLTGDGFTVRIVEGATGHLKRSIDLRGEFKETEPFTFVIPARLFTPSKFSSLLLMRHHSHVPHEGLDSVLAINLRDLQDPRTWRRGELMGVNYAPGRVLDLDEDGLDEVITGLDCFNAHGDHVWKLEPHSRCFTTLQVADLMPWPGLEVVICEYGHAGKDRGMYIAGVKEQTYYKLSQNTHSAVPGNFFPDSPTWQLLVRNNTHVGNEDVRDHRIVIPSRPAKEREISVARLDTLWKTNTERGGRAKAEYTRPIDWDGDDVNEILAIERHVPQPRASVHCWRTGKRLAQSTHQGMMESGVRVYDVLGDAREEFVIWNPTEITVYFNPAPSRNPSKPSPRKSPLYRRIKSVGNILYNAP